MNRDWLRRRPPSILIALLFGGAVVLTLGGCPIDTDAFLTDTARAALDSAVSSLIDQLGQYLAGQ